MDLTTTMEITYSYQSPPNGQPLELMMILKVDLVQVKMFRVLGLSQ